ncbi:MAG: hypothetical protein QHC79_09280 [Pseudosphingobacterium sp.]|nr:hypothetical protein [Pseudosphingobacterium sp.]
MYRNLLFAALLMLAACDSKEDLNPIESCRMPDYSKYEFSSLPSKPTVNFVQNNDKTVTIVTSVTNSNTIIFEDGSTLALSDYNNSGSFRLTEEELETLATKRIDSIFGLSLTHDDFRKNMQKMSLCYYETYLASN